MRQRRATLVTIGALGAFGPLSIDTYLPALPNIADDLHTTDAAVQLSLTACLLGLAVGQLFAGPLSDRHGRRRLLLASLVAYSVISALCVVAPTIELFIALRLAQGLAGSAGLVIGRAVTRDLYEGRELGRILSRLLIVTMAAPVLAPVIGALVLQVSSWRGTFVALTIISAAILLATATFLPETLPPDRRIDHRVRDDLRAYRRIAGATDFLPYLIVTSMCGGLLFAFISGSPFVVQDVYGHSATTFSLVFAFVSACMIAAGQVNARLVGSHAVVSLLRVGMIVSVAGSAALLVVSVAGRDAGLGLWVGALAIAVAPNGVVNPNATALAMQGYGANAGAAAALLGLAMFVLGAATAPLVGVAGTATGIPMAVMMLVAAATGLMALRLLGRSRADVDGSSQSVS